MGVLVLSPDFVKSFRLFHFRRKEMESQEVKYVGVELWKEKYRGCSNQFGKLTRT
ncbi:hypothetical protein LEP1GSC053_2460 [Leptospira interrogans serovar Muenchen str. Brem 129]|nr:hypothetical protein LEP1GSC053_2460 [Leptospira interrogans serovar Muenchen str. Brem 129]